MPTVIGLPILEAKAAARLSTGADLLVPEVPRDLPTPSSLLGAPVASADGDLAVADRLQALRSRVVRMVANVENAYAHLAGWGMAPKRGRLARASDLARMALQAQRRLLEDPDVRDASVTCTPAPFGVRRAILFDVRVVPRFGGPELSVATTGDE